MFAPLPVYEAAYGGNSLSWVLAGIHRVYMPGSGSMIRNRFRGNAIWNENRNSGCALRQGFVTVNRAREQQAHLPFPHFPTANLSR
jgi:hypothetical protein